MHFAYTEIVSKEEHNMSCNTAHIDIEKFLEFVNHFDHGHCKQWKAVGILTTVAMMSTQMQGERLQSYIENCLIMEGFNILSCYEIALWIEAQFVYIVDKPF
jgi:hypothetical protein